MKERGDALPLVVVEHRHLGFASPTPKHHHCGLPRVVKILERLEMAAT
jgi:hypothetical protein